MKKSIIFLKIRIKILFKKSLKMYFKTVYYNIVNLFKKDYESI